MSILQHMKAVRPSLNACLRVSFFVYSCGSECECECEA
jgi:hypothetical protein